MVEISVAASLGEWQKAERQKQTIANYLKICSQIRWRCRVTCCTTSGWLVGCLVWLCSYTFAQHAISNKEREPRHAFLLKSKSGICKHTNSFSMKNKHAKNTLTNKPIVMAFRPSSKIRGTNSEYRISINCTHTYIHRKKQATTHQNTHQQQHQHQQPAKLIAQSELFYITVSN